eukprot:TRINITY_DN398_c0_g1_i5.p1 TRINITY_DN398_c0_g1~~TRINITY_DN398_c0_g1_i5.p1  ORF type:complete len:230 (-),score=36.78 TRINITY_DN398_c0_g1_i5:36-725(-)
MSDGDTAVYGGIGPLVSDGAEEEEEEAAPGTPSRVPLMGRRPASSGARQRPVAPAQGRRAQIRRAPAIDEGSAGEGGEQLEDEDEDENEHTPLTHSQSRSRSRRRSDEEGVEEQARPSSRGDRTIAPRPRASPVHQASPMQGSRREKRTQEQRIMQFDAGTTAARSQKGAERIERLRQRRAQRAAAAHQNDAAPGAASEAPGSSTVSHTESQEKGPDVDVRSRHVQFAH